MRGICAVAVFVWAGSAAAAPCAVTVERAPQLVREAIDTWVSGEARCRASLAIWADAVDGGGFTLTARDDRGRVRARTVPDAEAAGVLVASWVADDAVEPGPVAVRSAMVAAPAVELVVRYPPREPHWILLGPEVSLGAFTAAGPRGQIDLVASGPLAIGIEAMFARGLDNATTATSAVVYGAYAAELGPLRLRTQLGVGGSFWKGDLADMDAGLGNAVAKPYLRAEASVLLGFVVAHRWQVLAGPTLVRDQMTRAAAYVAVGYRL